MLGYLKKWDKDIKENIIYPKIAFKIRKYSAFLNFDQKKYKTSLKALLVDT
jgi:hypothetical protein